MEGGHGEVEDWPLLFAVKARGKKKSGGEKKRKKGNRSHTSYASRLNCTALQRWESRRSMARRATLLPASLIFQPLSGMVTRSSGRGRLHFREQGEGAEPGCSAPQLGCSTHPAQVSLLHLSLPVMAFLEEMWNGT